jgi:hypothetical protein
MKRIIQANIKRFKQLLETEGEPTKRVMLARLLAEEEAKLEEAKLEEAKLEEAKAAPTAAKRAY